MPAVPRPVVVGVIVIGIIIAMIGKHKSGDGNKAIKYREYDSRVIAGLRLMAERRFKEIIAENKGNSDDLRIHAIFSVDRDEKSEAFTIFKANNTDFFVHSHLNKLMFVGICIGNDNALFFTESTASDLKSISFKCGKYTLADLDREEQLGITLDGETLGAIFLGLLGVVSYLAYCCVVRDR